MTWDVSDTRRWMTRIDEALAEQERSHARWSLAQRLFDMSYWQSRGFDGSSVDACVPVNYGTTFVNTLLSAIYARNPTVRVRHRQSKYLRFGQTQGDLLRRLWDEQRFKETMILLVRDTIIFGISWMEVGYYASVDALPTPAVAGSQNGLMQRMLTSVQSLLGATPDEEQPVEQGELDSRKRPGAFFLTRHSPYNVMVPPGYSDYWSLPFLILRETLSAEDFQNSPLYTHKDQVALYAPLRTSSGKVMTAKYPAGGGGTSATDGRTVELFHVWDRRSQTRFTLSRGGTDPHLGPEPWPYLAEGFPVWPLMFNSVPEMLTTQDGQANFYPFGDLDPMLGQILEKSKIRQQMIAHRQRGNFVLLVREHSATADTLNKLQISDAMEIIGVPDPTANSIVMSPPVHTPPVLFETENRIDSDLERESGMQLILASLAQAASIDKATVALQIQGNANLKTAYKIDRIESFVQRVGQYCLGLQWQYLDRFQAGELLGKVLDDDGWIDLPQDVAVARSRIQKELELLVEAGSTRPLQEDVLEREQFIRWVTMFATTSPLLYKRVERDVQAELAKRFKDPEIEQLILNATDQEEAEIAQQENALLLQGAPQVVGPQEDHETHLKIHAQAAQQGSSPALDQHLLQHQQYIQALQAGQVRKGQGTRQAAAAPSAAETARMGTPSMANSLGQAANLRKGTGAEALAI